MSNEFRVSLAFLIVSHRFPPNGQAMSEDGRSREALGNDGRILQARQSPMLGVTASFGSSLPSRAKGHDSDKHCGDPIR